MPDGLPPYILVARIGAVLGMSLALALGILLLIGGMVLLSLLAFAMFLPSFAVLFVAERSAEASQAGRRSG